MSLAALKRLRLWARVSYRAVVKRSPLGRRIFWEIAPADGVALTFDDGPNPEHTPRILDILARHQARATFFLVGEAVEKYPELVRRIAVEGHAIGNHTYAHVRCRELHRPALRQQIERTDAAIRAVLGSGEAVSSLFRPPFGELRLTQALYLARHGRTLAFWNQDARDYRGASSNEIAALGPQLSPGDVVLLHDRFLTTVEALPRLLRHIQAAGLTCATLGTAAPGATRRGEANLGASYAGTKSLRHF